MKELILASASPRRSELLKQIGLDFRVMPSDIEEKMDESLIPTELAEKLSYDKAISIASNIKSEALVIGADTIVVSKNVLGKPQNEEDAFNMLKSLQGDWHEVITGVTVIDSRTLSFEKGFEKTRVKMRQLSDDEIRSYINTKEPLDKAGAYGIQGAGAVLVERIEGCYFNVVGLPLTKLSKMLETFGINVL